MNFLNWISSWFYLWLLCQCYVFYDWLWQHTISSDTDFCIDQERSYCIVAADNNKIPVAWCKFVYLFFTVSETLHRAVDFHVKTEFIFSASVLWFYHPNRKISPNPCSDEWIILHWQLNVISNERYSQLPLIVCCQLSICSHILVSY